MKYLIVFLACILMGTVEVDAQPPDILKTRKKLQKATRAFDANYFVNPDNSHFAIQFIIDSAGVSPNKAQRNMGNLPLQASEGAVLVEYLDHQSKVLGNYWLSDPTVIWVCDGNFASNNLLRNGSDFTLKFSADSKIANIRLTGIRGDSVPRVYPVDRLILGL